MSANPYKDGQKSYRNAWTCNPYTSTVSRDEWQRGYDEAAAAASKEEDSHRDRRDSLWNVPEEARDDYMEMEDNFGPETVLKFTLALLAKHGGQP